MILADTSIWIDHLRVGDAELKLRLNTNQIMVHPFIVGEIALGILRQRDLILAALRDLPKVKIANEEEVLHFIDAEALFSLGIGYVDAHLLAATRLTPGTRLWSRDKRLAAAAARLQLNVDFP
ncbi:type II toxin-antitoxin system VapC family toxin [Phyllobacterium sp.]|uniref:type II toxin-antitoxin system VapC family toxin n=1 Tax=unclassified Phyllobacterium TaxID=2638441 RepID=UPI0031FD0689|nr:type II toxin-antitoxin system VapC family toxin [Phyllobacterium sp.]